MWHEKKYVRDMTNNIIGGVCSGFAKYFDEDVTIVRVLWCLITLLVPPLGFLVYILFWICAPSNDNDDFDKGCFV